MWFNELIQFVFSKADNWWKVLLAFSVFVGGVCLFMFALYKFIISKIKIKDIKVGNVQVEMQDAPQSTDMKEKIHEAVEEEVKKVIQEEIKK